MSYRDHDDINIGAVIKFVCGVFFLFLGSAIFVDCAYIDQNERGFKYNVSDGRPVSEENNPLLSFGWAATLGYDAQFFIVNSEVNSYSYTRKEDENSPYDESLTWDSREGVTMSVDFTILGQVTDPWKFYEHFGKDQYDYDHLPDVYDPRIYQALRLSGQFVDVRMGEIAETLPADEIRRNPGRFTEQLTREAAAYAQNFGFTVTDVIFPKRITFSGDGGRVIEELRGKLRDANSEYEEKVKAVDTEKADRDNKIALAKIDGIKIVQEAERKAQARRTEAEALAAAMEVSIRQVGVQGAMQLKMAELQSRLTAKGVIRSVFATERSIFAQPYYVGSGK